MLARAGRIMEPWFAALARPTAAVPSAAAHNNALAWRTSRAGDGRRGPVKSHRMSGARIERPGRASEP